MTAAEMDLWMRISIPGRIGFEFLAWWKADQYMFYRGFDFLISGAELRHATMLEF